MMIGWWDIVNARSRHCASMAGAARRNDRVPRCNLEAIKQISKNAFVAALRTMAAVLFSNRRSARKKAGLVRARLKVLAT